MPNKVPRDLVQKPVSDKVRSSSVSSTLTFLRKSAKLVIQILKENKFTDKGRCRGGGWAVAMLRALRKLLTGSVYCTV